MNTTIWLNEIATAQITAKAKLKDPNMTVNQYIQQLVYIEAGLQPNGKPKPETKPAEAAPVETQTSA